jgi:major membrane immunogen (membrane-anchored lipoprotein)
MQIRKHILLLVTIVAILSLAFVGCGGSEEAAPAEEQQEAEQAEAQETAAEETDFDTDYEDGVYFAQEDGFNERTGWKYMATIVVENGEIVEAEWNGAHVENGTDKITRSESGEYGMVANSDAQWPWYEQAARAEEYLLETQDPTDITYTDDTGHTDAISSVSIHVVEFFDLAEEALRGEPTGYGMWQDGTYYAEADSFSDSGWKDAVSITVVSGYIVAANWDPIAEDGGTNKKQRSMDGEYGMMDNSPAQWPWWEQARAAEQYLIEVQDPAAIELNESGVADAVSGATIHIDGFLAVVDKALEGAER